MAVKHTRCDLTASGSNLNSMDLCAGADAGVFGEEKGEGFDMNN